MTSLRQTCIEAMAAALARHHWPVTWERPGNIEACKVEARILLDALLSTLTEHAQDWADWNAAECADDNEGCNCVSDAQVLGLIAVLGEV